MSMPRTASRAEDAGDAQSGGLGQRRHVERLMGRAPMQGTIPIFIGDDVTDEPGFVAARDLGGHGILVGEPRPTAADFGLRCPADLRDWLGEAVR